MDLLRDAWIPVRSGGGTSAPEVLTYRQLLCEPGDWEVSLPRDDLELACLQLLICMTQVMFLPVGDQELRLRIAHLLSPQEFEQGIKPCLDWFDLDHETQPFMQTRGVIAPEVTPIQKLLIGLPAGNNHAFFNEPGEVTNLSGSITAIALFNQASNCPSFGRGYKGSLRGNAPITTLVSGANLRETVWNNVLTLGRVQERLPGWKLDFTKDQPTWIRPIAVDSKIPWSEIGLVRGLFWQPIKVELNKGENSVCDVLGGEESPTYSSFRQQPFKFVVDGVWPHPHGVMDAAKDVEKVKGIHWKFKSFTSTAPAWIFLTEFVVGSLGGGKEGSVPAGAVTQVAVMGDKPLHLLIGGYRSNQASIVERRHELVSLAQGWSANKPRLAKLVQIAIEAKTILRCQLYFASSGSSAGTKKLPGVGVPFHDVGEKLFFARTEVLIYETFSNSQTYSEWGDSRRHFAQMVTTEAREIFEELTDPYMTLPKLIPTIAKARKQLDIKLAKLKEAS